MDNLVSLHEAILDSLEDLITVIDGGGTITYVNHAWRQFAGENGGNAERDWIGADYLAVCRNTALFAGDAAEGIQNVLSGLQPDFLCKYYCPKGSESRWFLMRMKALSGQPDPLFIISHHNITQAKLAEHNIETLSRTDPVTGLFNRRRFDEFLADEWRRAMRADSAVSIAMFEVDHFDEYKDCCGPTEGNECLCKVGEIIKKYGRRATDLAVHFGGAEFALILGETNTVEASRMAEIIRKEVFDLNLFCRDTRRVTLSAGTATMIPTKRLSATDLVNNAVKTLSQAKEMGRNRLVSAWV